MLLKQLLKHTLLKSKNSKSFAPFIPSGNSRRILHHVTDVPKPLIWTHIRAQALPSNRMAIRFRSQRLFRCSVTDKFFSRGFVWRPWQPRISTGTGSATASGRSVVSSGNMQAPQNAVWGTQLLRSSKVYHLVVQSTLPFHDRPLCPTEPLRARE